MTFHGMVFCIVGKLSQPHRGFEYILRQHGAGGIRKTVTKTTTHLVVPTGDINENNSKVQKARELGTIIVDEEWCRQRFTQTSSRVAGIPFGPSVMLAKNYKDQAVDGWHMSEKLDGLRAIWDGTQFLSRSGNHFDVPAQFYADFPTDVVLDGELFCGRGNFDKASGIVRTQGGTYAEWENSVTYNVFDAPKVDGPFETRYEFLQNINCKHIVVCEQVIVVDAQQLQDELSNIVALGAEGIMLRKPGSAYECKRSSVLLKVKPMHDAECVVIGHESGRGKYRKLCGALVCEYKGKMFKVGSGLTDADRKDPPKMGSKITFGYFEITKNGVPRHPTFKRRFQGRA